MVVLLEGGYNLDSTSASVEAVLRVLLGEPIPRLPRERTPKLTGIISIKMAIAAQADHWQSMFMAHNIQAPDQAELEAAAAEAAAHGLPDSDAEGDDDEAAALRAEVAALQAEAAEMAGEGGESLGVGRRRRVPVGGVKTDVVVVKEDVVVKKEDVVVNTVRGDDVHTKEEDVPAQHNGHNQAVNGHHGDHDVSMHADHDEEGDLHDAPSGGVGQHLKRRKLACPQSERYKWELLNALHYSALATLHRKSEERRHSTELVPMDVEMDGDEEGTSTGVEHRPVGGDDQTVPTAAAADDGGGVRGGD